MNVRLKKLLAGLTMAAVAASGSALAPGGVAHAAGSGCREIDAKTNITAGVTRKRAATIHLKVYWCYDGLKITEVADPDVYVTKTLVGDFVYSWSNEKITLRDRDPQHGGYWTKQLVLTGTFSLCLVKYGCIVNRDIRTDLSVFGDGVHYRS